MIIVIQYYDFATEMFGQVAYQELEYKDALQLFHYQHPTCEIDFVESF